MNINTSQEFQKGLGQNDWINEVKFDFDNQVDLKPTFERQVKRLTINHMLLLRKISRGDDQRRNTLKSVVHCFLNQGAFTYSARLPIDSLLATRDSPDLKENQFDKQALGYILE